MNKNQVANRYGRILVDAYEIKDISAILEGIKTFSKVISLSRKLKLLFVSSIFKDEEKEKALRAMASNLKMTPQTEKFLKTIIMRGHVPAIKEIIAASVSAYNEKLRKMSAVVISPVGLDRAYIDRLRSVLKAMTQKDIEIENRFVPSLLGGFIVRVGSTVYDSSLRGQFRLLRAELTR
ncbi:MAG: ATP synthase F1 subunit delta [Nitrospirae bacterium]|nr:ATP synthase F1 subunit delta [Nitrospirota bacterium]